MAAITIDARMIRSGGIGSYLQSLLSDLDTAPQSYSYCALVRPADEPECRNWKAIRPIQVSAPVYSPWEQLSVPWAVPRGALLHVPHYNAPMAFRGPLVITVHDLIHLEFPGNFRSRAAAWYARQLLTSAVRKARRIITGSQATKRALIERCRLPESRIRVIPYRLSTRLLSARPDTGLLSRCGLAQQRYFLYVGQFKIHKNIMGLMNAFASLAAADLDVRLVAVAYIRDERCDLASMAEAHGLANRVLVLGKIGFGHLRTLYENAIALVTPSFAEGFGLPVMEAMALGTPVVASRIPAHEEAAGPAAVLVDPYDPRAICAAMAEIMRSESLRRDLSRRGRERAQAYARVPVGRATAAVYEEALS